MDAQNLTGDRMDAQNLRGDGDDPDEFGGGGELLSQREDCFCIIEWGIVVIQRGVVA